MDFQLAISDFQFEKRHTRRRRSIAARANWKLKIGNRRSGFTLLEVILSVSLTVALSASVLGFYFLTLRSRAAVTEQSETLFAQQRIISLIAEDVKSAIDVGLAFSFEGGPDKVSFIRARVPSPSVFYQVSSIRGESEDQLAGGAFELQADYELVTYYLEPVDEDDEEDLPGPLIRSGIKALRPGSAMTPDDVALSEHVRFFHVEYFAGEEWAESWTGRGIPKAIRITLGSEPLPEGTDPIDYPYATVWREVAIPTANAASRSGGQGRSAGAGRGAAR